MAITLRSFISTSSTGLLLLGLTACTLTPNTGDTTTPVSGQIRKAFAPSWSPSGDQVAFLYRYQEEGSQEVTDALFTILQNGTDLVKVRNLSPARFDSLAWSPNGNLFLLTTEDTQDIYITERNGQNLEKIAEGEQVSWSPNADKFVSVFDNRCEEADRVGGRQCQRQLRLYDIPSRTHIALNVELPREVIAPNWSSDGLRISWLSTVTNESKELGERLLQLHSYNLASEVHQITEIDSTTLQFSHGDWAADETEMAFDYLSRIHLYAFQDRRAFEITTGVQPDLSEDKNRIAYANLIGENRGDIAVFDRATQRISTLISHQNLPKL